MKVTELIDKLKQMPPDAEVETEGCDCIGQAEGVRLDGDSVLITRTVDEGERVRSQLLYPMLYEDLYEGPVEEAVK